MTKQDIKNDVSKRTGVTGEVTSFVIDEAINVIAENVMKGNPIFIRGLFTLAPVKRAEKTVRNIGKGTTFVSPAHLIPHAKFAKEIVDEVKKIEVK